MRAAGVFARQAAKTAVLAPGVLSRRRAGDLMILLYHRVVDGRSEIELPVELFREQLAYLSDREHVVGLDEALRAPPSGGIVVTFDDGYADFAETVVPALVEHSIPATLYLTTSRVGGRDGRNCRSLSWPQLEEAVSTGLVAVGAHTHTHADLSCAGEKVCEEEMKRSKELIEDRLSRPCLHFAYPWAVSSSISDRIARRLFDSAAVGAWRTNRKGLLDPYKLGRTPVLRSDGRFFFRAKVGGLLDGEAFFYRAARRGPWRRYRHDDFDLHELAGGNGSS
jgi:peptidoglycan/xylan/chitin deacetylase (PgdA/CDA1 family)